MNEPFDPRPQETANRLRLVVLLPVLVTVVGVVLIAAKLAGQFNRIEEAPARDYPPNPPRAESTPGRLLPTMAGHAAPLVQSNAAPVTKVLIGAPASAALRTPTPTNTPTSSVARLPAAAVAPSIAPTGTHGTSAALGGLPTGGIVGRVSLRGTPPAERALPMDPTCGGLTQGNSRPMTRFFVVDTNGALADVFVWLFDFPDRGWDPPVAPLEIRQRGCEYLPYVSAAQIRQTIRVFNDDPILHNVHPTPNAPGNRERNLAQLPGAAPLDFSFAKPELFLRFKCDVHPWMFAYVNLIPHPFFAVTGTNGSFAIPEPPPGDYLLQILHRKTESRLVKLSVRNGRRVVVNVEFDVNNPGQTTVKVAEE